MCKLIIQVVHPYNDMEEEWNVDCVGVVDMDESYFDMYHIVGKVYGATWPRHGPPRGTLFKV
jgi:hypothetical protein